MSWWRRHWRLGLALILTGFGLIAILVLWALRNKEKADELRVALALSQAKAKVAGLEADKDARAIELVANRDAAKELDAKILEAKKNAVAVVKDVDQMSDIAVAEAFRKMGYDK